MPLFGHKHAPPPQSEPEPVYHNRTSSESPRRSFFNRRRSSSSSDGSLNTARSSRTGTGTSGGLFHRNHEDQSITAARQRVIDAEAAERDADRALMAAREAVKDARGHVRALELEAKEEARLAKLKAKAAGDISQESQTPRSP